MSIYFCAKTVHFKDAHCAEAVQKVCICLQCIYKESMYKSQSLDAPF